ncbi:hypothetical protein M9Y10_019759 [Tritrichomonas musculus]|uniref:Uncharacterized protein n=1 Tax=Tritrichomonas musculus TaxID=1915356 RepID=A0ABR2HI47_9EUKA
MSKQIRGSRRLAIIQRWLQGHDDENYEVLPTRTEGRYIVRERKKPVIESNDDEPTNDSNNEATDDESDNEQTKPTRHRRTKTNDPTIDYEILNELKQLGEEMKMNRQRKEQKQLMKEVFRKQMNKQYQQPSISYNDYSNENNIGENIEATVPRRRNNIFADMA